jgi:hypothetical protein
MVSLLAASMLHLLGTFGVSISDQNDVVAPVGSVSGKGSPAAPMPSSTLKTPVSSSLVGGASATWDSSGYHLDSPVEIANGRGHQFSHLSYAEALAVDARLAQEISTSAHRPSASGLGPGHRVARHPKS